MSIFNTAKSSLTSTKQIMLAEQVINKIREISPTYHFNDIVGFAKPEVIMKETEEGILALHSVEFNAKGTVKVTPTGVTVSGIGKKRTPIKYQGWEELIKIV